MGTCSNCGYDVVPGDNFCANCGARYDAARAQVSTDSAADPAAAMAAASGSEPAAAAAQPQVPPGASYGSYGPPQQPPGQFAAGPLTPPDGVAAAQFAPPPGAGAAANAVAAPAVFGIQQTAAVCPKCGQAWTGAQSCTFCGQVWGLPQGIVLSSAGRRLGGVLLDGLLIFCTLVIGWIVWTLIVWAQGQTPGKQLLGMRVVRLDTRTYAGWGRMFLRDFVGKFLVALVSSLIPFVGGIIADCWLLWDKDKQELWDKIAGTIVVDDPDKRLLPAVSQ
jgi:uncharacterized RDD family membrane protein YckC